MRKKIGKIRNETLAKRYRRKLSLRQKVVGSAQRPRLSVCRTNRNLFVQMIDDDASKTIFTVQTFGKNALTGATNTVEGAKLVGAEIAKRLKDCKIETAVLDRNGYRYTGIVAALADTIRENGIKI